MSDPIQQPSSQPSSSAKPLWVAVSLLGAAVLAMGGTMLYQRSPAAVANASPPAISAPAAGETAQKPAAMAANDTPTKPVVQHTQPAHRDAPAAKQLAAAANGAAPSSVPVPLPTPSSQARACIDCGSVESVTPVQRSIKPSGPGIGAVAGGVLGAVLGNQVGQGNGKTVATLLGAVGGGFAGNAIENNVRKETVYAVSVRMDDGSRRSVELAQAPSVGSRVTLEGSALRLADGTVLRAPAAVVNQPPSQNQNQSR
jgi:outer membrane lipoprotein SlyB